MIKCVCCKFTVELSKAFQIWYKEKIRYICERCNEWVEGIDKKFGFTLSQKVKWIRMRFDTGVPPVERDSQPRPKKIIRRCFNCGTLLSYKEFIHGPLTYSGFSTTDYLRVWNSDYIEIYCCNCYYKALNGKVKIVPKGKQTKIGRRKK